MGAAPRGTVTFLFTDIEGSTRLWERAPDAMRQAVAAHEGVLRRVIEDRAGYIFSSMGDGLAAAFWTPQDGVEAALAAQRELAAEPWPEGAPIRVRMGLHTGTAEERDGDYFGSTVNRAARVMGAGHGGQILLSQISEALVRDLLPGDARSVDMGEHRLTGVARPMRLFQLSAAGLVVEFPPLRTADAATGNLPTQLTRFIGRTAELEQLEQLVREHRVVCITGTGGMGKTRTSLAVAANLSSEFSDGVWLAELASVSQPEAVDAVVMAALGQPPVPGMAARDVVIETLSSRRALLVLDNCEHVVDAAAELVTAVARACAQVHVLATSRQALDVEGERRFPLPALRQDDQIELFQDRAAATGTADASADDEKVGQLCARLDGMPLAIELAAARLRSMSLAELAQRLDQRLPLLSVRAGDPRHRTLEAVVAWSFDQLDETARRFFCMLSVFAGGFDATAAGAVTGYDELTTLDLLDRLVDRSLVVASREQSQTGYRLLETLRQHGRAHLDPTDAADTARRHAEYFAAEVGRRQRDFREGDDDAAIAGITACWDNLREAVHNALEAGDADLALRLATSLFVYMFVHPDREVADWVTRALALPGAADHRLALWAHLLLSQVAYVHLDPEAAERHARRALEIAEDEDRPRQTRPHLALGYALALKGGFVAAVAPTSQAIEIARQQGRTMDLIEGLHNRVCFRVWAGAPPTPEDVEELARLHLEADSSRAKALAAGGLGLANLATGSPEATEMLTEAGRLATATGFDIVAGAYRGLAHIAGADGLPNRELAGLFPVLEEHARSRLSFALRANLRMFAPSFSALARHRTVGVIEGGATLTSAFPERTEQAIERARHELGAVVYEAAVAEGRAMSDDELAGFIRSELDELGIAR